MALPGRPARSAQRAGRVRGSEGAELSELLDESGRATLRAICDTVVPPIERDRDPDRFWRRKASDLGVEAGVEQLISQIPDPSLRAGLVELIGALAGQGIGRHPSPLSREQILRNAALASPEAAGGVAALVGATLFIYYGAPDLESGQNPNWKTWGYPGPLSPPPPVRKPLELWRPQRSEETLECDVCVVGSGSGGGVVAATLAERSMDVVVLEAAGYFNEADFRQLELQAYREMYWRGGPTPTADGNVSLLAGTTLGGGTTINWTSCLRTRPWVREQWAREHGLEGVDGAEFDAHLDAVLSRIGANDRCSDLNGVQQRLREGSEALGWSFETVVRNADPERYSPDSAGYIGFGDQSGSKQSGDRTFLADAQSNGARLVAGCRARRILIEAGSAAGVEAAWSGPDGSTAQVTVKTPRVVVACGALESPALLRRSKIGGPAVGQNLRLHPTTAVVGVYGSDQKEWWGAPQAGLCDEFADTGDGYGFLIETAQYAPGIIGSATPWLSAAQHKEQLEQFRFGGSFIGLTRDRGGGIVAVDRDGEAVPSYPISDEVDVRNLRRGLEAMIRLHEAAGAHTVTVLSTAAASWRRGDDLEAYVRYAKQIPVRAGGVKLFSAHQMGSCRMGEDLKTSVADPRGELHDAKGVWIGDGSAFPSSSGTNPMVSIMALARRTAFAIAEDAGAGAETSEKSEEVGVGN